MVPTVLARVRLARLSLAYAYLTQPRLARVVWAARAIPLIRIAWSRLLAGVGGQCRFLLARVRVQVSA